jgi:predicted RNase H-like nuclease (RuvC/YqgF family)
VEKYSQRRRELRKQVERLEQRIAQYEGAQATLVARYQATEAGTDYAALNREIADVQQKLADTVRRWEAHAVELDELEQEYARQRAGEG